MEATLPSQNTTKTIVTYELVNCISRIFKFQSVKSGIRRDLVRMTNERCRALKFTCEKEQIEKEDLDNSRIEINGEAFLSETEISLFVILVLSCS